MQSSGVQVGGAWLTDPRVQDLLRVLNAGEEQALVVGGAVRNTLFDRPVADVDIATTAVPQETVRRVEAAGYKAVPTGIDHGTITAVAGHEGVEITTLREDVETDGRRAVVVFGRSWQADAERRDFTVNALYCDARGMVYDPTGSGLADSQSRIVRFIGDPDRRLQEDYLRLLRFFRFFATYGDGRPEPEGLAACVRQRKGLKGISEERIGQEMRKLLVARHAGPACSILSATGIAQMVFGQVANPAVLTDLIAVTASAGLKPDFVCALAAFAGHAPDDGRRLTERLRLSNAERDGLGHLLLAGVALHGRMPANADLIDLVIEHDKEHARRALLLARARLATGVIDAGMAFIDTLSIPDFPLAGRDLIAAGLQPGPEIGLLLARARSIWRSQDFKPGRDDLLREVGVFPSAPDRETRS